MLRFGVLGPVRIDVTDGVVRLAGPKQRAVLAALLVSPNTPVPPSRLREALWNSTPPASADANLRGYVAGLRRALCTIGEQSRLCAGHHGYRLEVRADELDLAQFEALAAAGRASLRVGDYVLAAQRLQQALALWRGAAFDGVPHCGMVQIAATHADEARIVAVEDCAEAQLALGKHAELVSPLLTLSGEHPLRERLWRQLMLAQYRSGLPARALDSYRKVRAVFAENLGLEPGPELRSLHDSMLVRDPALDVTAPRREPVVSRSRWRICQLPPDTPDFTGRTDTFRTVEALLAPRRTVPIVTLTGLPGAGKTTLAVRLAHALRPVFTDCQLYLPLAGGSAKPQEPAALLGDLLRTLGVAGCDVPGSVAERTALTRSLLSDRRVLMVLDDARDLAQIEPLLPGTAGCAVLITSRNRLCGLPGSHLVDVGLLSDPDARELLKRIVGARRLAAEPAATARVLTACGGLPLAIRIAGARLASQDALPVRWLADRLGDEHEALRELVVGDLAVRGSVALSYRGLSPTAAKAFRALGMLPFHDFTGWIVAVLLGVEDAEPEITALLDANMVQIVDADPAATPRCRMHDLLRSCAAEHALAEESAEWRHAAVRRLLDAYLTRTSAAIDGILMTGEGGRADAVAWLEAERANLIAAAELALTAGFDARTRAILSAVDDVCHLRSWWDEWEHIARVSLENATTRGDRLAVASAQGSLARVHCARGRADEALALFVASIDSLSQLGEDHLAATLRVHRSFWISDRGFSDLAQADATSAAATLSRLGDRQGHVLALRSLGQSLISQGRSAEAVTVLEDALRIAAGLGRPLTTADVSQALAVAQIGCGRYAEATSHTLGALATYRELGHRPGEAYALLTLVRAGDPAERGVDALVDLSHAMSIFRHLGDRRGQAHALFELGRTHAALGDLLRSSRYLTRAREAFCLLRMSQWAARALAEKERVLVRLCVPCAPRH